MTRHSDPKSIERDIASDREKLAATLDALQARVSVDTLTQDALGLLRANSAIYTRSLDTAVRANPLAVALVGAGLAWLVFGKRKAVEVPKAKLEALSNWEDDGGPARPSDEIVPAAGAVQRNAASEPGGVVAAFASGLKDSLHNELGALSEVAKDRASALSQTATAARKSVQHVAATAQDAPGRMIEDHPMVTGAVMLALGAALGAALPGTQAENSAFGAERDRLMNHAARALADEKAAIGKLAGDIGGEIADTARDTLDSVGQSFASASRGIADNVGQAAKKV